MNAKPVMIDNKWHVEVHTKEFGTVLLQESSTNLPIPMTFETEEDARKYLNSKLD